MAQPIGKEPQALRIDADGLQVEFEVTPVGAVAEDENVDPAIAAKIKALDAQLETNAEKLDTLNAEIDRLTNHADGWDYALAVVSGVTCGLIDSFFVGDFDWANAKKWSYQSINKKVSEFAKSHGYGSDSKRLKDHISFLEGKYEIPSDSLYNGKGAGVWTKSHHLDDFAHHPTLVGWICSVLTQFTRKGYFANSAGVGFAFDVERNDLIGDTIPEKFAAGTINWIGHLVSDVAGSSSNPGGGMGLPGPLVSLVKEFSQLPLVNKTNLPKLINDAFVKNHFDLRKELALGHELGRQAIPVVLNELIVRLFYFFRHLVQEWRQYGFAGIHWRNTLPFKNRTIVRMLTIAHGTFTAVDLGDAAIRAGLQSGGNPAAFWASFVLKVNFVGVGRFVIAVTTDVAMGVKLGRKRWERVVAMNERLHLSNARVELKNAGVWMAAERTEESIMQLYDSCAEAGAEFVKTRQAAASLLKELGAKRADIEKHNPGLLKDLADFMDEL